MFQLLSYSNHFYGYGGYGRMYMDPTMLLAFLGLILTMIASAKVKTTFAKYDRVRALSGLSGAEAAERVLHTAGIFDVRIRQVRGSLTDHYDPRNKTLNLSESTYASRSIAAVCVAAHECGHAIQDQKQADFLCRDLVFHASADDGGHYPVFAGSAVSACDAAGRV